MVRLAPYLTIVGVIFSIPAFLALLGLGTFMAPIGLATGMMAGRLFLGSSYLVSVLFLGAMILLEGLAIPGLFSRSKKDGTLFTGVFWLELSKMLSALTLADWSSDPTFIFIFSFSGKKIL